MNVRLRMYKYCDLNLGAIYPKGLLFNGYWPYFLSQPDTYL